MYLVDREEIAYDDTITNLANYYNTTANDTELTDVQKVEKLFVWKTECNIDYIVWNLVLTLANATTAVDALITAGKVSEV